MSLQYLYDLHVHTQESSLCGRVPAKEMVRAYFQAGYSGLVITDHLNVSLTKMVSKSNGQPSWQELTERLLCGFRLAKEEGIRLGMDIFLGAEIRFPQNDCDYLIYGFSESDLLLPEFHYIYQSDIQNFFLRFGHKLFIVQAHPFRDGNKYVPINSLHGVEVFNSNIRHCNHNESAHTLAENFSLLQTAGSDSHRREDIARCGVGFHTPVHSINQLISEIQNKNYDIVTDCPFGETSR